MKKTNITLERYTSINLLEQIDYIIDCRGEQQKNLDILKEQIKLINVRTDEEVKNDISDVDVKDGDIIKYIIKCKNGIIKNSELKIRINNNKTYILSKNKQADDTLFNIPELESCEYKYLTNTIVYFQLLNRLSENKDFLLIVYSATRTVIDLAINELIESYNERRKTDSNFKLVSTLKNKKEFKPSSTLQSNYDNFINFIKNLEYKHIDHIKNIYFKNKSEAIKDKLKKFDFEENTVKELNLFAHNSTVYGNIEKFKSLSKEIVYFLVFVDYSIGLCKSQQ